MTDPRNTSYFVMEYVEGENLDQHHIRAHGPLVAGQCL